VPERVLVTGGSGTLGRLIVPRLRSAGCEVRVASRRSADVPVDLATGAGLAGAVAGCQTILHLAKRGARYADVSKVRATIRTGQRTASLEKVTGDQVVASFQLLPGRNVCGTRWLVRENVRPSASTRFGC
jgi:uncharacterized protein YbjT (DUF2867 family)